MTATLLDKVRIAALCLALVCGAGCASKRHILFGIYAVPIADLPEARAMGLDFVIAPKDENYLDAAKRTNLKVIGGGQKPVSHPALMGNYLTDEPDLFDIPPWKIAKEFKAAKRKTSKPAFLNLSSAYSIEYYASFCDVPMFDWYPVGWQPVETYFANLRVARLASSRKGFFAVVQAFDWARYPKVMPPNSDHRIPMASEVKAMALWSAMNGASGIAFYPFDDGTTRLGETPELIEAIRETVWLIRKNEAFFTTKRAWAPYPFHFQNENDKYNSILETSIAVRWTQDSQHPNELLLVAANTTARTIIAALDKRYAIDAVGDILSFAPLEVKFLQVTVVSP